jgi:hypothetical protein
MTKTLKKKKKRKKTFIIPQDTSCSSMATSGSGCRGFHVATWCVGSGRGDGAGSRLPKPVKVAAEPRFRQMAIVCITQDRVHQMAATWTAVRALDRDKTLP